MLNNLATECTIASLRLKQLNLTLKPLTKVKRSLSSWKYQASGGRDLRLDLLRGWCIFSMIVDHAAGDRTTPLFALTGNAGWPISGAQGFVFISGAIIGILYGKVLNSDGFQALWRKIGARAIKLYLVAVGLGLLDLVVSAYQSGNTPDFLDMSTISGLISLTTEGDPLMTFYLMLLAIAIPVLVLLARRQTAAVLILSAIVWLAHQFSPEFLNPPFVSFAPIADWQFLFVIGIVLGYERDHLARWLVGWRRQTYLIVLFSLLALFLLIQLVWEMGVPVWFDLPNILGPIADQIWTEYSFSPPLHMLAVLVYLFAFFHIVGWFWMPVNRVFGWLFIPFGQAALYVYTIHQILIFYILSNVRFFQDLQGLGLAIFLLGLVGLIWIMVKRRILFAILPR